jgi:hypothetical protein
MLRFYLSLFIILLCFASYSTEVFVYSQLDATQPQQDLYIVSPDIPISQFREYLQKVGLFNADHYVFARITRDGFISIDESSKFNNYTNNKNSPLRFFIVRKSAVISSDGCQDLKCYIERETNLDHIHFKLR